MDINILDAGNVKTLEKILFFSNLMGVLTFQIIFFINKSYAMSIKLHNNLSIIYP